MANPTTNYSFAMPTNTDLVKDLPADFEIFGQAVDTKIKDLNPETTDGDISYRGSTANAKTRLPIGTAGQVLAVNSGATAPEWVTSSSGGLTLLSTTTLSGATTTISGISGSYVNLVGIVFGAENATADGTFRCAPNGTTTITTIVYNSDTTTLATSANAYMLFSNSLSPDRTSNNNSWGFTIYNYASTTSRKPLSISGGYMQGGASRAIMCNGQITTTNAITSLVFSNAGGNHSAGTVLLYGVK